MKKLLLSVLALTALGCGVELDRSSEVKTLRVLGMHKTKSYAQPGDEVTFSMLWYDPEGRDVRPQWFVMPNIPGVTGPPDTLPDDLFSGTLFPTCVNPPQDSYYGCLAVLAGLTSREAFQQLTDLDVDPLPAERDAEQLRQDSITVRVPRSTTSLSGFIQLPHSQTCSARANDAPNDPLAEVGECSSMLHGTQDPRQPELGSLFMWYALCPGELKFDDSVEEGFPLICLDDDGNPLGPDDYVLGYSQIYVYEDLVNRNPVMRPGMEIDGERVDACVGVECLADTSEPPTECGDGVACLDVCTKSNEDDCDEVDIKPIVPQAFTCNDDGEPDANGDGECANAERDEVAFEAYDRNQTEQMWIRYYADQGRMSSEVRLLNDALQGWNSDYGTKLRVPTEPGPVTIWAVAADNRGGQNWVRAHAVVR